MAVSTIHALAAFPLTEMDRQGVSGNLDTLAALGAETSSQDFLALLAKFTAGDSSWMEDQALPSMGINESVGSTKVGDVSSEEVSQLLMSFVLPESQTAELPKISDEASETIEAEIPVGLMAAPIGEEMKLVPSLSKIMMEQNRSTDIPMKVPAAQPSKPESLLKDMKALGVKASENPELNEMDLQSDASSHELDIWGLQKDLDNSINVEMPEVTKTKLYDHFKSHSGLKNLADSLYVHKQLGPDVNFSIQEMKAEISHESAQASMVRENLVEDMKAFVTQIVESKDGGSINLKLRPGNMGEVQVKVEVNSDIVRVSMETESSAAEQVLRSQFDELKQQLQSVGLKIDELQISNNRLMDSSHGRQENHQRNEGQQYYQQHKEEQKDSREAFFIEEYESSES